MAGGLDDISRPSGAEFWRALADGARRRSKLPPVVKAAAPAVSPLQAGLLLLWQKEPEHPYHNVGGVLDWRNPPDHCRLEQALKQVLRRQEALRTSFSWVGGRLVAAVHPNCEPQIERLDLSRLE